MATVSPPKPWERGGTSSPSLSSNATTPTTSIPQTTAPSSTTASTSQPPALPAKPSSLTSVVNSTASNYSPYGANRMGTSPYGVGAYGSYASPYSRLGGMNSMYGGLGGSYGGMYGGLGGMGGMGGMYGSMGQPGMNPNDPNSLTNTFNQNTQATFQMIESIVGAFGGFAQMLESTYMATHSSFFAMISVAEQFSTLRTTLGSILGIYTLLRWLRTLLAKITGRPPPADATSLTPSAFAAFQGLKSPYSQNNNPNGPPIPSKKPFLVFLLAVFGLPYLMSKLIRSLASQQQQQQQENQLQAPNRPLDASQLLFCRVLYDYTPPNPSAAEGIDLTVKKGDLVAVLSQEDPAGNASEWWRCRSRDGKIGYLPGVYLQSIVRNPTGPPQPQSQQQQQQPSPVKAIEAEGGRAKTMSDSGASADDGGSRANSLKDPAVFSESKAAGWGVEEFQKGGFYS
ncbi:MAG: hypothetical protein Q9182_002893 [Xanthomendoza sp. 2 TL-2023]